MLRHFLDVEEDVCVRIKAAAGLEPFVPGRERAEVKITPLGLPAARYQTAEEDGQTLRSFVPCASTLMASQNSPPATPRTPVGSIHGIECDEQAETACNQTRPVAGLWHQKALNLPLGLWATHVASSFKDTWRFNSADKISKRCSTCMFPPASMG